MMHSQDKETILGIDPGTKITGFGLIESTPGKNRALDFGSISPPSSLSPAEKYLFIYRGVEELIKAYTPTAVAVETQFVYKNVQSAMKLGMARGVVLLISAMHKIPVFEYAPKKAKLAVVGNGSASKEQVQKMIQLLLNLRSLPTPEDAADALALCICHANTLSTRVK
jgi:crossover junction endodeoxyribonuclease RuvC